ncbi:transposase, IS4 family [Streptomyces sp. 3214.6]|nr:transposase, IS4 family [Streptomyces sp. 3214.6]
MLDVGRETAEPLAQLLREHRDRLGTRKNTHALGVFKQGILVLRWFDDGTRLAQLARHNQSSVPTAYRYLYEGLTVLADHAPDLSTALERAAATGYTHLNLDGTVIRTDRVAVPHGADLWWSGKHKHHGGNVQVYADSRSSPPQTAGRSGFPGPSRPRTRHHLRPHPRPDHRTEPTRRHPRYPDPDRPRLRERRRGLPPPGQETQGRELGLEQQAFNKVIRGIHSVAERAHALLKVTLMALRRVSLGSGSITRIARAVLVLLQMEHGSTT